MAKSKGSKKSKTTKKKVESVIKEKSVTKDVEEKSPFVEKEAHNENEGRLLKPKFFKFLVYVLIFLVTLIAVDFIVQYINNGYSVAIVNGYRIPRSEFEKRLEESYGDVIATQLINEQIVLDAAKQEEVTVSDDEIQALVDDTIETIGGEEAFQSALEANGLTEESYRRNLKIQLLAEKMVVTEPTEEELLAYFEANKETYFDEDVVYEDVKDDVKDLYKNEKFQTDSTAWLTELREKATIQDNITDKPSYGLLKITLNLLSSLNDKSEDTVKE